jgi:hypothetical protein
MDSRDRAAVGLDFFMQLINGELFGCTHTQDDFFAAAFNFGE